jgi:hypothetical protein
MVRQGTTLQHGMVGPPSEAAVHCCPKSAHTPPLPLLELVELAPVEPVELALVELLLPLPPGPASEGGSHGPQTPEVLPVGAMQVSPGQQSALTVHLPQAGTQLPPW